MAIINFKSGRDFPSWTFTHFISSSEKNYRKLVIIGRVMDLIAAGRADADLKVALNSPERGRGEPLDIREIDDEPGLIAILDEVVDLVANRVDELRVGHVRAGEPDDQRVAILADVQERP